MIFFNQIINAKGTPSIYEDTLANRPAASSLGRLFVRTDNPYGIYRDQGTSWQLITGSGGGSQNWDQVLAQGGALTQNRSFSFDYSFGLNFTNGTYFQLQNIPTFKLLYTNNSNLTFTQNYLRYFNSSNVNNLLSINYLTGDFASGDYAFQFNGTHMNVNVSGSNIYLAPAGRLMSLWQSDVVTIGDANNNYNQNKFIVDDGANHIYTAINGNEKGLSINNGYFYFGDYNSTLGIKVDTADQNTISSFVEGESIKGGFNISYFISQFGSYGDVSESMYLEIDGDSQILRTISRGYDYGIYIYNNNNEDDGVFIGDYFGNKNSSYIGVEDLSKTFLMNNLNVIRIQNSPSVLSTSSGSTSSQHLVVYINGSQYKIQLRNP
jgi:hypothetical protein